MDLQTSQRLQQQRAIAAPPTMEIAVVTADASGGTVTVDCSGNPELLYAAPDAQLAKQGDNVQVIRSGGRGVALLRTYISNPVVQPATGSVTAAPAGSTISVSAGGRIYAASFLASYTPVVGNTVELSWHADSSLTVLGKLGAVPAPPPPPPPPVIPPPPPPAPPAPPVTSGSTTFPAIDGSGSFRNGKWRTDKGDVVQSDWGGYGDNFGAWLYGSGPKATLSGATIDSLEIFVTRRSGGTYGSQNLHFYLHSNLTRPVGAVSYGAGPTDFGIAIGGSAWVPLSTAWGQYIVDTGGGIGIFGSPYVVLNGLDSDGQSGALRMAWHR